MAASAAHANEATRQKLARGLALNRISFGAGLILAPGLYARTWVGKDAARHDATKLLARALGARDLALGAGGHDGRERPCRKRHVARREGGDEVDGVGRPLGGEPAPCAFRLACAERQQAADAEREIAPAERACEQLRAPLVCRV